MLRCEYFNMVVVGLTRLVCCTGASGGLVEKVCS